MNIVYWIIAIVVVVGLVFWYMKSKKSGPGEMGKPEEPMQSPPTTPGV